MTSKRRPRRTTPGPSPKQSVATDKTSVSQPADIPGDCRRCGKHLNRKTAVLTKVGVFCKRHADRIAPHLRRGGG